MHLLAAPRPGARKLMEESDLLQMISQAQEVARADKATEGEVWFKHLDLGDATVARDKCVERIRQEIESGFEGRMR